MKITAYSFGKIEIDGDRFNKDIILNGDRIIDENWWREGGGHLLTKQHLSQIIAQPERGKIIIGKGYSGRMSVPDEIRDYLESEGFEVVIQSTKEAVQSFNNSSSPKIGAFHITC